MNLTANKFCLDTARELALYARMAYDEPPDFQDAATDTQGIIHNLGDCMVVAFRGTTDLRDFVTDAEAWRLDTSMGAIHRGFFRAFSSVRPQLLAKLQPSSLPIFVCGHSLGGALAQIAAKVFRNVAQNVHSVYTFGCPRTGDKTWRNNYERTAVPGSPFANLGDATFNIINDCDPVPRLPGWLAGYRRPGHDEFIPWAGGVVIKDAPLYTRFESDLAALWNARKLRRGAAVGEGLAILGDALAEHHIESYIDALNGIEPVAAKGVAI